MKVNRILETALYAEDLNAAEAFYTKVLGLEVYSRVADRHVFLRCGSSMVLLFNPLTTEKEPDPHGCHGPGHAAWAVPAGDLDAWRNWLIANDVTIEQEIDWPYGHSIYFRDPAGNSLELAPAAIWRME